MCTDNGAMVAWTGIEKFCRGISNGLPAAENNNARTTSYSTDSATKSSVGFGDDETQDGEDDEEEERSRLPRDVIPRWPLGSPLSMDAQEAFSKMRKTGKVARMDRKKEIAESRKELERTQNVDVIYK